MIKFESVDLKKVIKYVGWGVAAVMAASSDLDEKRKDDEFERMKKVVEKLEKGS